MPTHFTTEKSLMVHNVSEKKTQTYTNIHARNKYSSCCLIALLSTGGERILRISLSTADAFGRVDDIDSFFIFGMGEMFPLLQDIDYG